MNAEPNSRVLSVPLLERRISQRPEDQRAASRFVCRGHVQIDMPGDRGFQGDLLDVSAHGFRVKLAGPCPAIGTEMRFSHQFFQGRARVMWANQIDRHCEAGCMIIRD